MNDNQKAATFTGWQDQGSLCEGWHGGRWSNEPKWSGPCPTCGIEIEWKSHMIVGSDVWGPVDHPAQAPDMSQPENFWRALQVLRPRVSWSLDNESFTIAGRRFSAGEYHGLGNAIVAGLAAYHDIEAAKGITDGGDARR